MISPLTSTQLLSTLDNERSLAPLLVKDLINSGGKSVMELYRGGVGAHDAYRERMVEEFGTTAVWIGGRGVINKFLLDPMMRLFQLDPKVDMLLLLKKMRVPSWLAPRRNAYLTASILRFAVGTLLPVAFIVGVIPKYNQAYTRWKISQERAKQQQLPQFKMAASFQASANPFGTNLDAGYPAIAIPGNPMPWGFNLRNPRFGATLPGFIPLANVINNPLWSNVAIDLGISSGRLSKARNWGDAVETGVREASVITFLYFLGDFVKNKLKNWIDHTQNTLTGLSYDTLHWMRQTLIPVAKWQEDAQFLQKLTPKTAFKEISKHLNQTTGRFEKNAVLELARLQGDIAIASRNEKMPTEVFHAVFGAHPYAEKVVDARKFLDVVYLQKNCVANTPENQGFVTRLIKLAGNGRSAEQMQRMEASVVKTSRLKGIPLAATFLVSTVFISILTPLFQHWLIRQLTGKTDFPGIREDLK